MLKMEAKKKDNAVAALEAGKLQSLLEEKQNPITFLDALGRRFTFLYEMCFNWSVSLHPSKTPCRTSTYPSKRYGFWFKRRSSMLVFTDRAF